MIFADYSNGICLWLKMMYNYILPCRVGLVVSVPASHTVARGFASRLGHTKDHHTNYLPALHAFVSRSWTVTARLSQTPGSVWNCLWGHALKRYPEINPKVGYCIPVPDFYLVLHGFRCRKSTIMD